MEQNDINRFGGSNNPRIWSGLILVAAGVLLLSYKMGAPIPYWLFTWPVLLIVIGVLVGIKSRFHNPGAFIMMIVGGVFLIDKTNPGSDFHNYILPAILIGVGIIYILQPKKPWGGKRNWQRGNIYSKDAPTISRSEIPSFAEGSPAIPDASEYVEINNFFGGVKRNILSKNFKGGEIHNFMSGAELNLLQADMPHPIVLEVHNIFGGTKLIVPSNWDVKNEMSVIFGGVEDKRNPNTTHNPDKIMVIRGTCIFGGVEVSGY